MKIIDWILGYNIYYCEGCKCIHQDYALTKKKVKEKAEKIIKEQLIPAAGYWLEIVRTSDREVMFKWSGADVDSKLLLLEEVTNKNDNK